MNRRLVLALLAIFGAGSVQAQATRPALPADLQVTEVASGNAVALLDATAKQRVLLLWVDPRDPVARRWADQLMAPGAESARNSALFILVTRGAPADASARLVADFPQLRFAIDREGQAATQLKLSGLPVAMAILPNGEIAWRNNGLIPGVPSMATAASTWATGGRTK